MDITYQINHDGNAGRFNYRVAAIIERENRILVTRHLRDGFSFLPGGRVKLGETSQQALARELHEELGVENADITHSALLSENFFSFEGEIFHEIGFYFHVKGDGLALPQHEDIQDDVQFLWVDKTALGSSALNLKPAFLRQALGCDDLAHITQHIIHSELGEKV